jgi:LCP family protein required for cell wall assembly
VYVKCPGHDYGYDKINAAYSDCGSPGTLDTIRSLTGLQVNYLITVNFRGFQQVVDKLGGIWMDVDHRYYHSNAGTLPGSPDRYSEINLYPGYQKLNGSQALSYVRYRHTDNDIYRTARQQAFVKAVREQISKVSITDVPRIISAIVRNVIVGKKGGGAPSDHTIFNYAWFLYHMPRGNIFQVKIPNLQLGPSYVTASQSSIQEAIREFERPDVKAPEEAGSVVLHHRIGPKTRAPAPHQTTVTLLNGNGYAGSATLGANGLHSRGYRIVYPPNGIPDNAPHKTFRTQVYFDPSKARSKAAAHGIANLFGAADVGRLPQELKPLSNGSMVVVVVGLTFHGSLAPAPVDHTPPKQPAEVTASPAHTRVLLRRASRKVPFKLEFPRLIEKTSTLDPSMPIRTYAIDHDNKAVRLTYVMGDGLDHWGIQETDWTDAPVLADSNFPHTIKGREFDFFWNGPDLHMVVLHQNGATYWVVNTLLDTLSPQTMVAIAKSLTPMPPPRRKR